jgi:hypothetical protein
MTNVVPVIRALKLPASFRALYAGQPVDAQARTLRAMERIEITFVPRSMIRG